MSGPSLDMHELFNLEDKVALVTGGSRGIGYIMAQGPAASRCEGLHHGANSGCLREGRC